MAIKTSEFFTDQTEITKLKLLFFENYIESYLYKILPTFGSCRLFDPFCGPGKSGTNLGSPLVLLTKLRKVIATPTVKARIKRDIITFFSDADENNVKSLTNELKNWKIESNKMLIRQSTFDQFFDFLMRSKIADSWTPKFIFLDPFGYSKIPLEKIKKLSAIPKCEILLFIPLMDVYRFANQGSNEMEKGTKKFLETYTDRPLDRHGTFSSPKELMLSINNKLQAELSGYVRPMLFDAGSRKNCLFLITSHIEGLILANEMFCNNAQTRLSVHVTADHINNQSMLGFDVESVDGTEFKKMITDNLVKKDVLTNKDIIELMAKNFFCRSHAERELTCMLKEGIIVLERIKRSTRYCIGSNNLKEDPKVRFRLKK